jgi:hypothetical protein
LIGSPLGTPAAGIEPQFASGIAAVAIVGRH